MRLATFKASRASYGAVTDDGIVDLGRKLARFPTLLDVLRAGGSGGRAARVRRTTSRGTWNFCRRSPPRQEHLRRHQLSRPHAEYKDGGAPKYPNLFCRFPGSLVGSGQPIVRPKVSDKFDYEGEVVLVIGGEGRHVPREARSP